MNLHQQYEPQTVKRKIASLKAFFRYLEYKEILDKILSLRYKYALENL